MKTLTVQLAERSYPIYIGNKLLAQQDLYRKHIRGKQVLVVTNDTIAPLYLSQCIGALSDFQCQAVILPDGEKFKNMDTLNKVYDALLSNRFDRGCTLLALGGGVVGDITGFAAATYQRGVDFVQVPTTLLAQVDSSVGGKTGVNHPLGKNMIGAFHQPQCVIADIDTLNTLEDRQLSAGIAEIIKYGVIGDRAFFDWLEINMSNLLQRDPEALAFAIERSCKDKSDVVTADELEAGQRALLNFGHTFGHAIENAMGYGQWLHGEAIATGMSMAADLSMRHQWLCQADVDRIDSLLQKARLPLRAPKEITTEKFMQLMAVDKKVKQGVINLVLLDSIGQAKVTNQYHAELLQATLQEHPARHPPTS